MMNEKECNFNMELFNLDDARIKQSLILGAILTGILLLSYLGLGGFQDQGFQNICIQYIVISTAFLAVISASISIIQDKTQADKLKTPLFFSGLALFSAIYTYFLSNFRNEFPIVIVSLFFVTTFLIFSSISIIVIMVSDMIKIIPSKQTK